MTGLTFRTLYDEGRRFLTVRGANTGNPGQKNRPTLLRSDGRTITMPSYPISLTRSPNRTKPYLSQLTNSQKEDILIQRLELANNEIFIVGEKDEIPLTRIERLVLGLGFNFIPYQPHSKNSFRREARLTTNRLNRDLKIKIKFWDSPPYIPEKFPKNVSKEPV